MSGWARAGATLIVTALATAYLVWKIDVAATVDVIAGARPEYLLGAVAIMLVTVVPMAWRWQRLLGAQGVEERLSGLVRTYLVGYTAG